MREWARTDEDAAASVRAADQRVLAAVRQAFLDYGFDPDDADLRANATFAAGIGFLHLAGAQPSVRAAARRERLPRDHAQALTAAALRQIAICAVWRRFHTKKYGSVTGMSAVSATAPTISPEFVARLAERAQDAERLRQLPAATIDDLNASGFTELLVPARYGGRQADFPAILDPVRRMAHGCASSAWTIGFYALHNWILALFDERAQEEAFATRPFLAPAPLAPTGRGVPTGEGVRLTGRWSWATGVMHGNWIMVGALCGPDDGIYPALALLPAGEIEIEDVWHTDGMRATGSNDVVITDVFVPAPPAGAGVRHLHGDGARRRAARRRHLPLADGARPGLAGGDARARQCRTRG